MRAHLFITARVRSTREGNILTRVCPSINLSVHRGGYPYPIVLCNISQNAMRQRGGTQTPPGGYPGQVPPRGVPGSGTPRGGTQVRYPPGGVPGSGTPPGGYPGQVPPGGEGVPRSGTPPGGYPDPPPRGGTQVGQQKEYSLHGGRYASCVHAGGLSC